MTSCKLREVGQGAEIEVRSGPGRARAGDQACERSEETKRARTRVSLVMSPLIIETDMSSAAELQEERVG